MQLLFRLYPKSGTSPAKRLSPKHFWLFQDFRIFSPKLAGHYSFLSFLKVISSCYGCPNQLATYK